MESCFTILSSPNLSEHTVGPLVVLIFLTFPCGSNAFPTHKRKRDEQKLQLLVNNFLLNILLRYNMHKVCQTVHNAEVNLEVVDKRTLLLISNSAKFKAILVDSQGQVSWWTDIIIITKFFQIIPGIYYMPESNLNCQWNN